MMTNQNFRVIKDAALIDDRGRLSLGQEAKAKIYRVLINDNGQILLDPVINIPERELWLWQKSSARASLDCGIQQAASNDVHDLGSFAHYADLEIDD